MATIIPRGRGWQAQVRLRGRPPVIKTFRTKTQAQAWSVDVESDAVRGLYPDRREAERLSVADLLRRYRTDVTPHKKSAQAEASRIAFVLRDPLARLRLADLRAQDLADFRDRRLEAASGSTVIRDLTLLSHMFNVARKEWGIGVENPCVLIRRPRENRPRRRRLGAAEEALLLTELAPSSRTPEGTWLPGGCRNPWIQPLVRVALETAMRRGELLTLRWTDVFLDARFVRLHDSKNGEGRDVPLSSRALDVLNALPRDASGAVFPVSGEAVKRAFMRAVERAGLHDFHFHDLRHEATSRLATRLDNVLELSAVTGHRSVQMLKRYFHPLASELAKKLG